ncbi:hypothetical protein T492DRAFT_386700 [Pavlovales sp. CCMP2436]|nr:hypothetical protein T492DRAFT_386700 [Pavlovales sp. CCMP2436]
MLRTYGRRSHALANLADLLHSAQLHHELHARVRVFAQLAGLLGEAATPEVRARCPQLIRYPMRLDSRHLNRDTIGLLRVPFFGSCPDSAQSGFELVCCHELLHIRSPQGRMKEDLLDCPQTLSPCKRTGSLVRAQQGLFAVRLPCPFTVPTQPNPCVPVRACEPNPPTRCFANSPCSHRPSRSCARPTPRPTRRTSSTTRSRPTRLSTYTLTPLPTRSRRRRSSPSRRSSRRTPSTTGSGAAPTPWLPRRPSCASWSCPFRSRRRWASGWRSGCAAIRRSSRSRPCSLASRPPASPQQPQPPPQP